MAEKLRLGIAGVGIAATQVLPHIGKIADKVVLTAVADRRPEACAAMAEKYPGIKTFDAVETMCRSNEVDVVWVSTPNEYHAEHAILAAQAGKHVVCEKPMAVTLEECNAIIEATTANKVRYVQGHSKIYYEPLRRMREVIKSGRLGRVTQINSWNYNDWLIRPMTANEVKTDMGTGPVFRQGPHQIDIVRYLAGTKATSLRAAAGRWEPAYPETETDYSAFLLFEETIPVTLSFNAHGYFEVAELTWGIGEGGRRMLNADSARPRERRTKTMSADEKFEFQRRGDPMGREPFNGDDRGVAPKQPFFGITIVSCERGALRQSPDGIYVYDKDGRREIPCAGGFHRGAAELLELHAALEQDRQPFLDAAWGRATLEVCIAILDSARQRKEVQLKYQTQNQELAGW
jgi:phthalate 4,5-cis-dihydrodiol dehydrogenase